MGIRDEKFFLYRLSMIYTCTVGADDAEDLYEAYQKYADGQNGVVFACDVRHAGRLSDCYGRHGVRSAVIGFRIGKEKRGRLTGEFEAGAVKVLVCVDYYAEGMRCPDVDFVQQANPTVLDHAGLTGKFGLPIDERDWPGMFSGKEKKEARQRSRSPKHQD